MKTQYKIGLIHFNQKTIVKDCGCVCELEVPGAIDKIQSAFFGRNVWAVVMDLDGQILYRSDHASQNGINANQGWQNYLKQQEDEKK